MTNTVQEVRYLVFDVESVADGQLIAKTRYPDRNLSADEAILRFRQEFCKLPVATLFRIPFRFR